MQGNLLGAQALELVGPGQEARLFGHRAAGHGAAGVHDLAVQGDDLKPAAVLPGHGDGAVQLLHNDCPAQEILHYAPVPVFTADQPGGHSHKAPATVDSGLLQRAGRHGAEGQEGGPAASCALQKPNGRLGVGFCVHHNLLHGGAQGDLYGCGKPVLGVNEVGHGAVDMQKATPPTLLHDATDRLVITLKILFHGPVDPGLG